VTDDTPKPAILDPSGKPARQVIDRNCPRCGAGPELRVASGGFGTPWPVCSRCGHEWTDEVFKEPEHG
jgi:uncharacterized protein (DUF983 family)